MIPVNTRGLLRGLTFVLTWAARFLGYCLNFYGGMIFAAGVLVLAFNELESGRSEGMEDLFQSAGLFLTFGWLLLRFAAGLFPFGRRMFR